MLHKTTKESILLAMFIAIIAASGIDLVSDLAHGIDTEHLVKEVIIVGISTIAIAWLLWGLHQQRLEIHSLQNTLESVSNTPNPPKKYVLDARKKLGNVVSRQFLEWSLTRSEIEVGWLLLKGLSLNEISMVRNTQEKTVRQQASSIYKKAEITGRHAFSAWFIEDIL